MSMRRRLLFALLSLPAVFGAPALWASDQAQQVRAIEERLARLEARTQSQALFNLLNQVEALKDEIARLRGSVEEQSFRIDAADQRAREIYIDLDARINELASRPATSPLPPQTEAIRLQPAQALQTPPAAGSSPPPLVDAEAERRAYNAALNLVRSARYSEGLGAFQVFLRQYPRGALAANAMYWMAFSHVGLSDFEAAAQGYRRLLAEYPNSDKAPDAMLSLARALVQMRDTEGARATLDELLARHPQSKAAEGGRKLLATLR